ncbi:phosphate ABC transporter permease PstA [Fructobacillus fructosus]|uniref:Phosphate transport system permease protein PstA n=1 Tax=Fructobacillus fructosus TaxID=1631 RepID=A0ABN9YHA1_9LACO|nr:phosphate ABC transporter permease PstA [Fructobacillus fructosus]MBD9364329.1 phosphate ABC transporter permease PstA [Leuconostoc mesenteroides]KRN53404.1 phosphate ABC transporter, permease protein [Fructobacillus fructosus KCTC 3544]MBC9118109.1 phosphate ABC transporter permease PstA [Fructobacillus fructosus]CAK1222874.1 ABC-type phosphate transport system [Fructobacillus fructosus]CAK1223873.1 ABC-type phosphate transport system [Fructobacillus fructosus]
MKAKTADKIATGVIYGIAASVAFVLIAMLAFILVRGLPHLSWHFLTAAARSFEAGGGIGIQLFNSFYLLILALLISFPIALGAAIYLNEYAKPSLFITIVRTAIEVMSSLPSVVVGLFGFLIFVVKFHLGFSILSGAIALTIFNLPILTRSIETSLSQIPNLQREAGAALGLSRFETVIHVILPASVPSIVTGVVISAGRVFGEAAALIYTAGQSAPTLDFTDWNPFNLASPLSPFRPAETLAVHIWKINSEGIMPDLSAVSAGASAVLIIVVLLFNFSARRLGNLLYKKLTNS